MTFEYVGFILHKLYNAPNIKFKEKQVQNY